MKDIHAKPFDESTTVKLELFKLYLREWLPVFIQERVENIEIFDFFSGPGTDSEGTEGSPLIILDEVAKHCKEIIQSKIQLKLVFNDKTWSKIDKLQENIDSKLKSCSSSNNPGFCSVDAPRFACPFVIEKNTEDFSVLFQKLYIKFSKDQTTPRLLFIDQYGVKHVTHKVYQQLINLKKTDFIFFISSMHIRRFRNQPEFLKYLNNQRIDFDGSTPYQTHRIVFDYFKSLIGNDKKYYLGQFSIKKNANIYGVIFGSAHPLGLRKFLDVAWKIDPYTGETNFDIDRDPIRFGQQSFDFEGDGSNSKVKKLLAYEKDLIDFLKPGRSNYEIFLYSIENGVSISKTNQVLKHLENNEKLEFAGDHRRKGAFYLNYKHKKQIKIYSI